MLTQIFTKARKFHGQVYPSQETEYAMSRNDDGSVTIYRNRQAGATFRVGDYAEYGSYNLIYVGEITKITDKVVTIVAYKGHKNMEQVHRLNLYQFAMRNYDFDEERVAKHNEETMRCI